MKRRITIDIEFDLNGVDVGFCRDLSWVPEIIDEAYKLGLEDGNSLDYID